MWLIESVEEYNQYQNELLSREVDYQKLILRVISLQSFIIVVKAIKYQTRNGDRRVKVTLRSTMEGNQEYLQQFQEHFDVFTPEMRSGKIYNILRSVSITAGGRTPRIFISKKTPARILSIYSRHSFHRKPI